MLNLIVRFRSSLVAKVFGTCFVSIHLPLIGLAVYLAYGNPLDPRPILLTTLLATLLGSALSFMLIQHFLSPIDRITRSLERYRSDGVPPTLDASGNDEMYKLAEAVEVLTHDQDKQMQRLRRQANSDPLTGLGNRRWLHETAESLFRRAARLRCRVIVIMFDLDHFKKINDTHGHAVGDDVLVNVAKITQRQLRPDDLLARIGGEEFCVVLVDDGTDRPNSAAVRLRSSIEAWKPAVTSGILRTTASFGVYIGNPSAETLSEMMNMADDQLYRAKAMGRNQVVSHTLKAGTDPK